jgi:uncharacterized protein (TIGR02001 family)
MFLLGRNSGRKLAAAGAALVALTGSALADGYGGSIKDAPVEEGRKFTWSITLGGTSDYVFRGISQTFEDPAAQGSIDVGYGIFYAGIWASNVDFGAPALGSDANAEVDLYAGIKPTWGPVTFDFGAIYYWYPGASNFGNFVAGDKQVDYVELKAGYSLASPWIKNLTTGTTVYWSPDYTLESGSVFTLESNASYLFPAVGIFTPTLSGAYGSVYGDDSEGFSPGGAVGDDDYSYWNVGLSLAVEKFTFDFRYWDTDIDVKSTGGSCVEQGLCDERFVFSAKVTLP